MYNKFFKNKSSYYIGHAVPTVPIATSRVKAIHIQNHLSINDMRYILLFM